MRIALILIAVLAIALATGAPASASRNCVAAEEAVVHSAGDEEEGAAPTFTPAFYARTFTLNASLDGLDGKQLPVSIEEICSVPRSLKKQAVQLAGSDAIALTSSKTSVWEGSKHLRGDAATNAVDGADTALLRVRLAPQGQWGEDEDGNKVATFIAKRILITD
jgi:hypothetical protein